MIGMHPGMLVRAIERGREKKCLLEDKPGRLSAVIFLVLTIVTLSIVIC